MPKLYSARIILTALHKAGFSVVSQKVSHIKLFKKEAVTNFTVIVPNHKEVAVGTFASILKQAGMSKEEFEKLIK